MLALILLLVLIAGYATQRGSVCAVAATHELVVERRAHRYLGFLFCAACSLLMMALGDIAGLAEIDRHVGLSASAAAVIGGATVGVGVYVNGRCAFGTVAELGSGKLARLSTLGGFIVGAAIWAAAGARIAMPAATLSPLAAVPDAVTLAVVVLAVLVLGAALWRLVPPPAAPKWSALRSMAVIGVSNGALLVLAQDWPYTNLLIDIARGGGGEDMPRRELLAIVFVCGAVAGGIAIGQFRLSVGDPREWLHGFAGGLIIGTGALIVPGGNDAMLLVGLPLLLPNLVTAYLVMTLVLLAIVWLDNRHATSGRPEQSPNSPSAG